MDISLPLLRHRLWAARWQARGGAPGGAAPRGEDPLIWAHAGPGATPAATRLILEGLAEGYPALSTMVTGDPSAAPAGAHLATTPPDTRSATRAFVSEWRPSTVLWTGDTPHPTLWRTLKEAGVPVVGADMDLSSHPMALIRDVASFRAIHTRQRDRRLARAKHTGKLATVSPPKPARRDEVDDLVEHVSTRSVWFAADVPADEVDAVLTAHRRASQLAHRLLLIVTPGEGAGDALAGALDGTWQSATRSDQIEPAPSTQVFVADDPGEEGIWARLAPITYLGGSLTGRGPGVSPMVPATLGSAILMGGNAGAYADETERLASVGATVTIKDGPSLGAAVETLQAPGLAADMAHAAWTVTSQGAEGSASVLQDLGDCLDEV